MNNDSDKDVKDFKLETEIYDVDLDLSNERESNINLDNSIDRESKIKKSPDSNDKHISSEVIDRNMTHVDDINKNKKESDIKVIVKSSTLTSIPLEECDNEPFIASKSSIGFDNINQIDENSGNFISPLKIRISNNNMKNICLDNKDKMVFNVGMDKLDRKSIDIVYSNNIYNIDAANIAAKEVESVKTGKFAVSQENNQNNILNTKEDDDSNSNNSRIRRLSSQTMMKNNRRNLLKEEIRSRDSNNSIENTFIKKRGPTDYKTFTPQNSYQNNNREKNEIEDVEEFKPIRKYSGQKLINNDILKEIVKQAEIEEYTKDKKYDTDKNLKKTDVNSKFSKILEKHIHKTPIKSSDIEVDNSIVNKNSTQFNNNESKKCEEKVNTNVCLKEQHSYLDNDFEVKAEKKCTVLKDEEEQDSSHYSNSSAIHYSDCDLNLEDVIEGEDNLKIIESMEEQYITYTKDMEKRLKDVHIKLVRLIKNKT